MNAVHRCNRTTKKWQTFPSLNTYGNASPNPRTANKLFKEAMEQTRGFVREYDNDEPVLGLVMSERGTRFFTAWGFAAASFFRKLPDSGADLRWRVSISRQKPKQNRACKTKVPTLSDQLPAYKANSGCSNEEIPDPRGMISRVYLRRERETDGSPTSIRAFLKASTLRFLFAGK